LLLAVRCAVLCIGFWASLEKSCLAAFFMLVKTCSDMRGSLNSIKTTHLLETDGRRA
jgi:hypothetical protein